MKSRLGWLALAILFLPRPAFACTIPVFRYALERWELAVHDVVIFHRGPLTRALQDDIARWQRPGAGNFEIVTVDLDAKLSDAHGKLWKRQPATAKLPWLSVQPRGSADALWSGSAQQLAAVLDSPARRQVVAALAEGIVPMVLLKCGDEKADSTAQRMLDVELPRLEKSVRLPEQSADGPQIELPLPLQVRFRLISLERGQEAEGPFVQMLLSSEPGLDRARGPILFPCFGRGRLLGSLFGKQLAAGDVEEVAQFLCKACSCQLKELNPGVDLVIAANWSDIFTRIRASAVEKKRETPRPNSSPHRRMTGATRPTTSFVPGHEERGVAQVATSAARL